MAEIFSESKFLYFWSNLGFNIQLIPTKPILILTVLSLLYLMNHVKLTLNFKGEPRSDKELKTKLSLVAILRYKNLIILQKN